MVSLLFLLLLFGYLTVEQFIHLNLAENNLDSFGNFDYTSTSTSVTFPAGSALGTVISISIPINNDSCVEQLIESFMIIASSVNPDVMFSNSNSAIVRITDNDGKYTDWLFSS